MAEGRELWSRSPGGSGSEYSLDENPRDFPFEDNEAGLKELCIRTGMPISQENGQRIYGPPSDYDEAPPAKGSEIFVKIPRDAFEPELIPVLEMVGKIYQLRMMMNFSGFNRGYAFAKYYTPEDADKAAALLNNYELRKGQRLGVRKSTDNCRLFFSGLPLDKTREEIMDAVSRVTEGVAGIIMFHDHGNRVLNRGYAYIDYNTHKEAAAARRKMLMEKIQLWGHSIIVDWATNKLSEFSTPFSMAKLPAPALAPVEFYPEQMMHGLSQPQMENPRPFQFSPLPVEVGAAGAGGIPQEKSWLRLDDPEFQPRPIQAEPALPPGVHIPQNIIDLGMPILVVPVPQNCPCGGNGKSQPGSVGVNPFAPAQKYAGFQQQNEFGGFIYQPQQSQPQEENFYQHYPDQINFESEP